MKKLVIIAAMFMAAAGVKAQDCEAIMLPYFNGDMQRLTTYRNMAPEKYKYRCVFAQSAFYESDTIPAGVEVMDISVVKNLATGTNLSSNISIDLSTFSFYAYNFGEIQVRNNSVTEQTCFSTPASDHPYLVLRSAKEMEQAANRYWEEEILKANNNR